MTARPINTPGYASPLTGLARMPGEGDTVGTPIRREAVAQDPLAGLMLGPNQHFDSSAHIGSPGSLQQTVLDPLEGAVRHFLSYCRITAINPNSCSSAELKKIGAWTKILDINNDEISRCKYKSEDGNISESWRLRLEAMFRLKMFDELGQEASRLLYQEEQEGQSRSNVALSMHLVICETKMMTGRCDEAVEQLVQLRSWLKNSIQSAWDWKAQCSIANAFIRLRQWRLAIIELRQMLVHFENLQITKTTILSKISLSCYLSRVLLQVGAVKASTMCGERAWVLYTSNIGSPANYPKTNELDASTWTQLYITRGLVLFGNDKFDEASTIFKDVIDTIKSRPDEFTERSLLDELNCENTGREYLHPLYFGDYQCSALATAINNYAICALYLKRVSEAITYLESLIQDNPVQHMIDPIVFNLCTLYDLSNSPEVSKLKKKVLQQVAAHYGIEEQRLYFQSFRLN